MLCSEYIIHIPYVTLQWTGVFIVLVAERAWTLKSSGRIYAAHQVAELQVVPYVPMVVRHRWRVDVTRNHTAVVNGTAGRRYWIVCGQWQMRYWCTMMVRLVVEPELSGEAAMLVAGIMMMMPVVITVVQPPWIVFREVVCNENFEIWTWLDIQS